MNTALTQQRIRIQFAKQGHLRFIGHLDLAQTWERALRRAHIPLEYTQGFNPRPRMQFAAALPVGVTSESEYLDVWLLERLNDPLPGDWPDRLTTVSPAGLITLDVSEVPIKEMALPTLVTRSEYVISPPDSSLPLGELANRVEALLAASQLERTRRGKTYDLRPLILDLTIDREASKLIAHLQTGDGGNGRPDELVDALGLDLALTHIHRRKLYLNS